MTLLKKSEVGICPYNFKARCYRASEVRAINRRRARKKLQPVIMVWCERCPKRPRMENFFNIPGIVQVVETG